MMSANTMHTLRNAYLLSLSLLLFFACAEEPGDTLSSGQENCSNEGADAGAVAEENSAVSAPASPEISVESGLPALEQQCEEAVARPRWKKWCRDSSWLAASTWRIPS